MQLPRYIKARSRVSELRSAQQSMISPAEAANVEMAKAGAIAAGAKTIGDVAAGMAEIQAKEELSSAIAQFSASAGSLDMAFEQKPYERDEQGNLVSDSESILNQERAARTKLASTIRSTMKSGLAKKEFDNWMVETGMRRDQAYQAKMVERESKVIQARLNVDLNSLLDAENYDGARDRVDEAASNGALGPLEYVQANRDIDKREVTDQVYGVLNAPLEEINPEMVDDMLERMESEEFDLLPEREKYTYINQLNGVLADLEGNVEDAQAEQQRLIYHSLLTKLAKNEVSLPDLLNAGLTDKTYFKDILSQIRKDGGGATSNQAVLRTFEVATQSLMSSSYTGDDWGTQVTMLKDQILDPQNGLTFEDTTKMITKLETLEKGIFGTELYRNLSRQAFENIVGFDEGLLGDITSGLQAQYKITADVGREFQQALMRKAERLGPGRQDELDKWVEEAKNGYRLLAGRKNLEKVGVNVQIPEDGVLTEELRLDISRQIQAWYNDNADKPQSDIKGLQNQAINAINEVERLYDWKLDEPQ